MSTVLRPPWFKPHMAGRIGAAQGMLPDVNMGTATSSSSFAASWASRIVTKLPIGVSSARSLFNLPHREPDVEKRDALRSGSLIHRTVSSRVRFLPNRHSFIEKKRKRDGGNVESSVERSAKHIQAKFNKHGGAARFVWNKAIEFIRAQPVADQHDWYKTVKLYPILIAQRTLTDRALRAQKDDESPEEYAKFCSDKVSSKANLAANKAAHANAGLIARFPWLGELNKVVLQQSLKSLQEAFKANCAAAKVARTKGKGVTRFKIGFKERSKPSGWTFVLTAADIKAEHIPRPHLGPQSATSLSLNELLGYGRSSLSQLRLEGHRRMWLLNLPQVLGPWSTLRPRLI